MICFYCKEDRDAINMRPYGPNNAYVCYRCAFATPERKAQTDAAFAKRFKACEGAPVVVLTPDGPLPILPPNKVN